MGQDIFICLRTDKRCTCAGDIENCTYPEKQEEKMKIGEKTQEEIIRERIALLTKQHKNLGIQMEQYKNYIQQITKQRISIKGGIIELQDLLPKPNPKKPEKKEK
jgi:hypothetical protein